MFRCCLKLNLKTYNLSLIDLKIHNLILIILICLQKDNQKFEMSVKIMNLIFFSNHLLNLMSKYE